MLINNRQILTTPPADGFRKPIQSPRRLDGAVRQGRAPSSDRPLQRSASATTPARDTTPVPGLRIVAPIRKWWRSRGTGQTAATPARTNNTASVAPVVTPPRKRRRVERVWPEVGTILTATYFGVVYRAQVVQAWKKLTSGKQILILTGSAAGRRANSFTRAMLKATSRQRRDNKLGVKGLCSGWEFWGVVAPVIAPESSLPAMLTDARIDARQSTCSVQPCPMFRKNVG